MQMKHSCIVCEPVESTEENKYKQIQTIMNTNNKNNVWAVETYETPTITTLEVLSEGVLCGSYDTPGSGYDNENDLGEI